jgi:hypothetical protein
LDFVSWDLRIAQTVHKTYVLKAYANRLNHFLVVTLTNVRVRKSPTRKAA